MIINSTYRDYYDTSNNGWFDKTIVYNRTEEVVKDEILSRKLKEEFSYFYSDYKYDNKRRYYKKFYLIGFCGKLYPVVNIQIQNILTHEFDKNLFIYNLDDYLKEEKFDTTKIWNKYWLTKYTSFFNIKNLNQDNTYFIKFKTPIFLINMKDYSIKKDIKLNDFEFYRIKDSWSAYNEIEIYLSNILLLNEKEIVEVSDKSKIISKGFDYKTSFRKEKEKK